MTSEEIYCNHCDTKFLNNTSLVIHNNYHHKNILKMWMQNDEVSTDADALSPTEFNGSLNNSGVPGQTSISNNIYNDNSVSSPTEMTSPSSLVEYDYKLGTESKNSISMVSSGPNSGSSSASFPQQSPAECFQDYSNAQQSPYNYQSPSFSSLVYDETYERQKGYAMFQRYQPYTLGRSPLPTPSPSASIILDIKEEPNMSPTAPAILDLDSQKFLTTNQTSSVSLPGMWRPSEQFSNITSNGPVASGGLGPMGMGSRSTNNVHGPTFNADHLQTNFMAQQHTLTSPHSQQIQRPAYTQGSAVSTFYPQGMQANPINSQYAQNQIPQNQMEDVPPQPEYPSNVKRAKSFRCNECNKWFTSHGHLKRHYNTTLHKNMVKNGSSTTRVSSPSSSKRSSHQKNIPIPPISPLAVVEPARAKQEPLNHSSPELDEANNYMQSSPVFPHHLPGHSFGMTTPSIHMTPSVYNPTAGAVSSTMPYSNSYPPEHIASPPVYQGHFSADASFQAIPNGINARNILGIPPNYCFPGLINSVPPVSQYSNPQFPVDAFNSFRLDNVEKNMNSNIATLDTATPSPIPCGDTGSESSIESIESNSSNTQAENFSCKDCNKKFNRMCYLTQHRSTYHDGEKPFKCSTCGKRFNEEATFQEHQSKHAGEKPYKCNMCPKQFNHKTDLRRHMCLHTGEKPFTCTQCHKGFIRKDHMLKHFQTHRKKQNNANGNSNASHPSMPRTTTIVPIHASARMVSHEGLPNHVPSGIQSHIPSGLSAHLSPGLPNLSPVSIPQHSPANLHTVPSNSPILNHPQFMAPHPPIAHPNHTNAGHSAHVVAPPVY